MNRNIQTSESSLLLQLPRSVLSFSDMSGNSFLMPVAVDNVAASGNSLQNTANTESYEGTNNLTELASICQLTEPLMTSSSETSLRRESPSRNMAVPYSQSFPQTANAESHTAQADVSHSVSPFQPSVFDTEISNQSAEIQNWSGSSTVGQPLHPNTVFAAAQNQLPTLKSETGNHFCATLPKPLNQENISEGYQNVYQEAKYPSYFPSERVPIKANNFVGNNLPDHILVKCPNTSSSPGDYYSQPPVITPSASPVYYTSSGGNVSEIPQATYPNISNQNYNSAHSLNVMTSELYSRIYEPVKPYWLFRDIIETKEIWYGFSHIDSEKLEIAFQQDPQAVVPVDGGRYDALLCERIKKPVYFEAKDLQIRRCTWFYRPDSSQRFMPLPEEASNYLEQHYCTCVTSGQWPKRVNLPGIGCVVLESPQLLLYYKNEVDIWPSLPDSKANPKAVRRGLPENFQIMPSENNRIDHLVFIVQGIGSFCDLRFRTVTECVDGFRDIANKLLTSHFRHEITSGQVGRVEFLPLAWHAKLHTSDQGFDRCMQNITLPSIPKLRHFTNDTLLDILLYSSPTYCQSIVDTVASELNKLYEIFLKRNPGFSGSVFVAGHSLGSLILFDILAHQKLEDVSDTPSNELYSIDNASKPMEDSDNSKVASVDNTKTTYDSMQSLLEACQLEEYAELFAKEKIDLSSVIFLSNDDLKDLGLPTGPRKKLLNALCSNNELKSSSEGNGDVSGLPPPSISLKDQNTSEMETETTPKDSDCLIFPLKTSPCMSSIVYPRLHFEPACFFALGSPISMFLTVRGYNNISQDFKFPTCPAFFHIFHPYDPVAFRIEPLIEPHFSGKPVLIPHHKGRKRMHLEIRENLSKVGSEIKQKVLETLRYTWESISVIAKAHTFPSAVMEAEVDKLVTQQISESEDETEASSETYLEDIQIGSLNGGRRIDYVLQEKPIEALNDYIFALTSHATYWDSEDTVLMILREIYATQGILVSSQSIEKQFAEQSFYETYSQLNSMLSNRSVFERQAEQISAQVEALCNPNVPTVMPSSSQSLHSLSNSTPMSPVSNTVPPPPPPATTTAQPLGPPPLTGFVKRSPFAR